MLAILYLAAMIYFGDCVCRYFFRFNSIRHRLATSFLIGLLLSSGITYLGSLLFASIGQPLVAGNLIFLAIVILAAFKMPRRPSSSYLDAPRSPRPAGDARWDWLWLGVLFAFSCWLVFATLSYENGNFQFGFKSWSDFGANLSLSQSFILGHNFPTEHPFFPGEIVRYHFLFWFQAANLSFLGLNLVTSVNLLSLLSLLSLLILIMTLAESLFNSRIVGRTAAMLFFFASSSLSYIPFLRSKFSLGAMITSIYHSNNFLDSGYPYRGENWGALSVDVFANQRHLISAVGIVFVVMIFLVDFYKHKKSQDKPEFVPIDSGKVPAEDGETTTGDAVIPTENEELPTAGEVIVNEDEELLNQDEETIETDEDILSEAENDVQSGLEDEEDEVILLEDEEAEMILSEVEKDKENLLQVEQEDKEILLKIDEDAENLLEIENIPTEYRMTSTEDEQFLTGREDILSEPENISDGDEIASNEVDEILTKDKETVAEAGESLNEDDEIVSHTNEVSSGGDELSPPAADDIIPTRVNEISPPSEKAKKQGFQLLTPADFWVDIQALLFSGFLIGALPYWNSAIFVSAMIVMVGIFLFFPYRVYMATLGATAFVVALPQILLFKSGNIAQTGDSLFHWGYTIPNPTVMLVINYIVWTFGFKLLLVAVALWFLTGAHRRLFAAVSILLPVVFLLQLSPDSFNNHKLLNTWNTFALIYAAYALWRIGRANIFRAVLAGVLCLAMIFGAIIDLFPVHNDPNLVLPFENDRLTTWVLENTKPSDIFLTQNLLTHPILFAGRKVYFGYTLFAWTASYDVGAREKIYKQMFSERDPARLLQLLRDNNIAYVGIDDGLRGNGLVKDNFNESVFQQNFEKVYEDTERRADNITIYKVPN